LGPELKESENFEAITEVIQQFLQCEGLREIAFWEDGVYAGEPDNAISVPIETSQDTSGPGNIVKLGH